MSSRASKIFAKLGLNPPKRKTSDPKTRKGSVGQSAANSKENLSHSTCSSFNEIELQFLLGPPRQRNQDENESSGSAQCSVFNEPNLSALPIKSSTPLKMTSRRQLVEYSPSSNTSCSSMLSSISRHAVEKDKNKENCQSSVQEISHGPDDSSKQLHTLDTLEGGIFLGKTKIPFMPRLKIVPNPDNWIEQSNTRHAVEKDKNKENCPSSVQEISHGLGIKNLNLDEKKTTLSKRANSKRACRKLNYLDALNVKFGSSSEGSESEHWSCYLKEGDWSSDYMPDNEVDSAISESSLDVLNTRDASRHSKAANHELLNRSACSDHSKSSFHPAEESANLEHSVSLHDTEDNMSVHSEHSDDVSHREKDNYSENSAHSQNVALHAEDNHLENSVHPNNASHHGEDSVHSDNQEESVDNSQNHSFVSSLHSNDSLHNLDDSQANIQKTKTAAKARRKKLRNSGKAYTTSKGKEVEERCLKPLKCKHDGKTYTCARELTPNVRKRLFKEYWKMKSYNKRVQYVASRLDCEAANRSKRVPAAERQRLRKQATSYHLEVNGRRFRVCKAAFLSTLGETDSFVRFTVAKKARSVSGFPRDDGRNGKKGGEAHKLKVEQVQAIRDHINSFPAYVSHYCRKQTQQKYLSNNLNLSIMHKRYLADHTEKVSYSSYRRVFVTMKLKFKPPASDTCCKCDEYEIRLKALADGPEKEKLLKEKELHNRKADMAYELKRTLKEAAKNDQTTRVLIFDLEQCLPTPDLRTGKVYYLRQLYTYNLTVFDPSTNMTYCYMWHEAEAGRGANEIASCLFKHIMDHIPVEVKTITLFSDCCSGQNRNSIVSAMYLTVLQNHESVTKIDHIFLVPGHTRMECDNKHSLIERFKNKVDYLVSIPDHWYRLVMEAGNDKFEVVLMKGHFYDFKGLYKPGMPLVKRQKTVDRLDFKWTSTCWYQYTKEDKLKINVKSCYNTSASFSSVSLLRRGFKAPVLAGHLRPSSTHFKPISVKKYKDLMELVPLIDEEYRSFYINLRTDENVQDIDPDIPMEEDDVDDDEEIPEED